MMMLGVENNAPGVATSSLFILKPQSLDIVARSFQKYIITLCKCIKLSSIIIMHLHCRGYFDGMTIVRISRGEFQSSFGVYLRT